MAPTNFKWGHADSIHIHHLLLCAQSQTHMADTACFRALASEMKSSPHSDHAHLPQAFFLFYSLVKYFSLCHPFTFSSFTSQQNAAPISPLRCFFLTYLGRARLVFCLSAWKLQRLRWISKRCRDKRQKASFSNPAAGISYQLLQSEPDLPRHDAFPPLWSFRAPVRVSLPAEHTPELLRHMKSQS